MASALIDPTLHPPTIPPAQSSDSEQVTLSLETAQALAENGDLREALRWLRRAADAAEQDGDDMRALTLARAAADLATRVGGPSLPPPLSSQPGTPAPPSAQPKPPAPPSARSGTMPKVAATDVESELIEAEPDWDSTDETPPPPSLRPPPPSARSQPPKTSRVPLELPFETPSVPPPKPQSETPAPPSARLTPSSPGVTSPLRSAPPKPRDAARKPAGRTAFEDLQTSTDIERLVAEGRAVRVSIKRSTRDKDLYVVRRLDSKKPPFGSREAFVVLAEPDPSLFSDDQDDEN